MLEMTTLLLIVAGMTYGSYKLVTKLFNGTRELYKNHTKQQHSYTLMHTMNSQSSVLLKEIDETNINTVAHDDKVLKSVETGKMFTANPVFISSVGFHYYAHSPLEVIEEMRYSDPQKDNDEIVRTPLSRERLLEHVSSESHKKLTTRPPDPQVTEAESAQCIVEYMNSPNRGIEIMKIGDSAHERACLIVFSPIGNKEYIATLYTPFQMSLVSKVWDRIVHKNDLDVKVGESIDRALDEILTPQNNTNGDAT